MGAIDSGVHAALHRGIVIPACPLVLTRERQLDERRQRALLRYYVAAGAGGLAVAVHTTQFAIRQAGLFAPLLRLVREELDSLAPPDFVRIGGVCGDTPQALREAECLRENRYHCALLSLGAFRAAPEDELLRHAREVARVLPLVGFYLQPSVGGRVLAYSFWRRFAEIEKVAAIKIAPFNRYQTLDVVRAVGEAGRSDIALYTGNDDNIVADLLTCFRFGEKGAAVERRIVGGLLGHWAVWTRRAVELLEQCHDAVAKDREAGALLARGVRVTAANAAFFDAANGFSGCVPGLHEVLRRQGLLEGTWCLDEHETLSPGQQDEIERVYRAYPELNDDHFIAENLDAWLH